MKTIRVKKTSILSAVIILSVIALIPADNCFAGENAESAEAADPVHETTIIIDMAGREVPVVLPAERIVLASARYLHEFAAVGGAGVLDNIVGWGSDLNIYDQDTYLAYEEAFPQVASIPVVGHHYKGDFSVEKVISLQGDVVVFPLWLKDVEGVSEDIERLEKVGIPSIFLDYYLDPFNHPVPSTTLIGKLLGNEDRAKEVTDFYEEQVQMVADRVASLDEDRRTAYIEVGSKGPDEYANTYSSAQGLGALIAKAGGKNIADGVIKGTSPINPEYLLNADPDIIVISGSYWPANEASMRLGYHATEEMSKACLESFAGRDGWDMLSAVQSRQVYSIFHGFSFRIYNFAGIQAVACWLYPDLFSDIDPADNFRAFHEKFSPVPYSGVWMQSLPE